LAHLIPYGPAFGAADLLGAPRRPLAAGLAALACGLP